MKPNHSALLATPLYLPEEVALVTDILSFYTAYRQPYIIAQCALQCVNNEVNQPTSAQCSGTRDTQNSITQAEQNTVGLIFNSNSTDI